MKVVKKTHNGVLFTCPRLLAFFADDAVTFDGGIMCTTLKSRTVAQLDKLSMHTKFQHVTMSPSKVIASSAKKLRGLGRMNNAPSCIFFKFFILSPLCLYNLIIWKCCH